MFLLGWLVMAVAFVLMMALATPVKAGCDWEKVAKLVPLTFGKGEVDLQGGVVYLQKVEKIGEAERRLYFVIRIALTPDGPVIIGIFCNEELWEKKIVDGEGITLVTQKMSSNGTNFIDAFVLKEGDNGRVTGHGSQPMKNLAVAEKWLDRFLTEMITFGQTLPDRPPVAESPEEKPIPAPTKVIPKANGITI